MTDWIAKKPWAPSNISSLGAFSTVWSNVGLIATITSASAAWPAANQTIFIPINLPFPFVLKRYWWVNGSNVTGSMTMSVYTSRGTRLHTSGAVGQSGASAVQYSALGTPIMLAPDRYYLAIANDGTTNRGFGITTITAVTGRLAGLLQQASNNPATATFATWTGTMLPLCGLNANAAGV